MVKGWWKAQRKFDEMGPERVVIICLQLKTISDINLHMIFVLSDLYFNSLYMLQYEQSAPIKEDKR